MAGKAVLFSRCERKGENRVEQQEANRLSLSSILSVFVSPEVLMLNLMQPGHILANRA